MEACSPLDALGPILDDVPDIVFAYTDDGHYLYINKAASKVLGADPFTVIGQHWRDLGYPPQIMEPLIQACSEVFATGKPDFYHTLTSPERGSLSFDISLTPLKCDDGSIVGVLAICRDVTRYMSCL